MDILKHNSTAWDNEVKQGSPWSQPVSVEIIEAAKRDIYSILLTPTKSVPRSWLSSVKEKKVLCLASGGGQQAPILAAAGAYVTVLDASPLQLSCDKQVANREGLQIETILGDMRNLSCFKNEFFDLIIHPISNCFIPDIKPVWREAYRILKPGASLLSGFNNPISYSFDRSLLAKGICQLKYKIPYSDLDSLSPDELNDFIEKKEPLEFGHSLEDQIGGQIEAGFIIAGFYEDKWGNNSIEDNYFSHFMATRSIKT